eukprot:3277201-Pyramimonas_sp.AAC.1
MCSASRYSASSGTRSSTLERPPAGRHPSVALLLFVPQLVVLGSIRRPPASAPASAAARPRARPLAPL